MDDVSYDIVACDGKREVALAPAIEPTHAPIWGRWDAGASRRTAFVEKQQKVYEMTSVKILVGDVRQKLKELPDAYFDCVCTSPPYWGLRDYNVDGQIGLEATLGEHLSVLVGVFEKVRRIMKPQATLWVNYGDCYATSPNGRSAAAIGPIYPPEAGQPFPAGVGRRGGGNNSDPRLKPKDLCMVANRLAIAMQDAGWWVRSEIVWGKTNPMPDSSGRYRPSTAHEKIFLFTKSAKSHYDSKAVYVERAQDEDSAGYPGSVDGVVRLRTRVGNKRRGLMPRHEGHINHTGIDQTPRGEGRLLRNYEAAPLEVWPMATAPFPGAHFACFPPELVRRCLLAGCPQGGRVLDPFGGAGTTALVAGRLGVDCTLIELSEVYAAMAKDRINADAPLLASVSA